jgi:photosystem II stability/assembly factor-like uncharacterized protein
MMKLDQKLTEQVDFHDYARRAFIGGMASACLLLPGIGRADGMTGIASLDMPAILVRNPARVILIAIARAGTRLVAVGEHGVIAYSDDDAGTWKQAIVPVDVTLTCVAFATPVVGWAAGHFGVVLITTDGGETWREQLNGITVNRLTLAAAQAAVAQTDNPSPGAPLAMRRANVFIQQGPAIPFLALLPLTPQKVIVFGAYRMTMMTTDAGATWSDWSLHIDDKFSNNLYAATTVSSNIYVAGESGLVFCSSDGGTNFNQKASPSNVTLFGVLGARDESVVVFGVAGNCFRSTDGGNSWVSINLGTQDDLTAGYVLASGLVVIAGLSGALYLSHDNGATFNPIAGTPPMSVSGVTQATNNALIFVGYSGVTQLPPKNLSE